jgi:RimJ/RimL family protein N-acetyltransferase
MEIQTLITTDRLLIEPLTVNNNNFILELVNTDGWIKFIGNRNVTSQVEATAYIQKIIDNPNTTYWVVKLKDNQTTIGIITFIKRDYLEHHDIGFAFLPSFANNGYAYEATSTVLRTVVHIYKLSHILATTVPENTSSIKLLKKLGLFFDKEIEVDKEKLQVYGVSTDKLSINEITKSFFALFTNTNKAQPNWNLLNDICIPEIMLISKTETTHTVYNLVSFIEPRQKILTDGTLTEFEENETQEQTKIIGNIAQRYSTYHKRGILDGKLFEKKGHKFLQFVKTNEEWKISSVIWEDENN